MVRKDAAPSERPAQQLATNALLRATFRARTTTSAAVSFSCIRFVYIILIFHTEPGYTCYRDSAGTALCRAPGSNNNPTTTTRTTTTTTTTTQPDIYTQTTIRVTDGFSTSDLVQATDSPTSFPGLPTTTTTPSPSNTTSSASRTSSSVEVPIGASGALAVTPSAAYGVLLSAFFVAVGQAFGEWLVPTLIVVPNTFG